MLAVDFEGSNITLIKPEGWTDENCAEARAYQGYHKSGLPIVLTCWKPNKEDLEALNNGGTIQLMIVGHSIPPVSMFTVNDKGEPNT